MALANRLHNTGYGLSKKDDDAFHPLRARPGQMFLNSLRRRRLLLAFVALLLIYVFVKNIPTDVPSVGKRYNPNYGSFGTVHSKLHPELIPEDVTQQAPVSNEPYDEPIRFHNLAVSLRRFGPHAPKSSVVFVLPRADSAAKMLPMACEMARTNRSTVHVALLGKQTGTVEGIMRVNGITLSDCPVNWHDATPDHAAQSSASRIHASIAAGLSYLHSGLQPSAFLVDDFSGVDPGLMTAVKHAVSRTGASLIALPLGTQQSMSWITLLDSSSLKSFNDVRVEIVIQPYAESAGSLIRLLQSLRKADYRGLHVPRLTIELPAQPEASVLAFLSEFSWPPGSAIEDSQLTLRRRIELKHSTPAVATLRTIESFYPISPTKSHVLVLNTNVELSPVYLHYLMFTILEYKHSQISAILYSPLIGISLDLPQQLQDITRNSLRSADLKTPHFVLAQSPNNNAALYFGNKWVELHSFLSHRLATDPQLEMESKPNILAASKHQPRWMVEAAEYMQARQLYMLYPMFAQQVKERLAILHTDLDQLPEEFIQESGNEETKSTSLSTKYDFSSMLSEDVLSSDYNTAQSKAEPLLSSSATSVVSLLPIRSDGSGKLTLPELSAIPLFSPTGEVLDWGKSLVSASTFADEFSLSLGGCSSLEQRDKKLEGTIDFLFCDVR